MSEYIVSCEQLEQIRFDAFMDGANDEFPNVIDKSSFDELIRCRDCKHGCRTIQLESRKPGAIECCNPSLPDDYVVLVADDAFCSNAERKSQ